MKTIENLDKNNMHVLYPSIKTGTRLILNCDEVVYFKQGNMVFKELDKNQEKIAKLNIKENHINAASGLETARLNLPLLIYIVSLGSTLGFILYFLINLKSIIHLSANPL